MKRIYTISEKPLKKIKFSDHQHTWGEELQADDVEKLFNEIIAENFPNLGKDMDIQVQEAFRISNIHNQNKKNLFMTCYS